VRQRDAQDIIDVLLTRRSAFPSRLGPPNICASGFLETTGPIMLQYLMSHPELTFSPPETADLCEAFDMAVAALQEREAASTSATDDGVRAALSKAIVEAWTGGEHDPKALSEQALRQADALPKPDPA
jgi:hypothetical protein